MSPEKSIRTILYFSLISMFTACQSDCDCERGENPYSTDLVFNTIKTTSIDNSGPSIDFSNEATSIPYKAIALRVALSDSVTREIVGHANTDQTRTTWYGKREIVHSDWFYPRYIMIKKISAIRMITLYDFSPEYPAGTELSELFKAAIWYYQDSIPQEYLYTEMDSTIRFFETKEFIRSIPLNLDLVLTQPALCDSMRLEISVEFDDNSALTDTTSTIYPIH